MDTLFIIINLFVKEFENVSLDLVKLGAPFHWVISIEVGEHIPSQYQLAYIGNNYNFESSFKHLFLNVVKQLTN